jgi:predicted nucleic acid-binding protein
VIRATLDVNVLVSGFPADTGVPSELIDRWANREYEPVLSQHILDGLLRAWHRPYWRARYSERQIQQSLARL